MSPDGQHEPHHMERGRVAGETMHKAETARRCEPLLTPEQVAQRLQVSPDWVRDHSGRKEPMLPVIRLGGGPGRAGLLRYRANEIEEFIDEMARRSQRRPRAL